MKKSLLLASLIYTCSSMNAQLSFSQSNSNVAANFIGHGMVAISHSEIYAAGALNTGGWMPKIYRSTDGFNWNSVSVTGINSVQVIYTAICYTGNKLFMGAMDASIASTGIYSSLDGNTWTVSGSGVPANFITHGLASKSTSEIYAAGALYTPGWTPKLYKSTDAGASWTAVSVNGISATQLMYSALCYTGNKLIMASQDNSSTSNYLYSSADGGTTWVSSNAGLPANFVVQDLHAKSSSEIYAVGALYNAGWSPKIYKSTDGGINWINMPVTGISATQESTLVSVLPEISFLWPRRMDRPPTPGFSLIPI